MPTPVIATTIEDTYNQIPRVHIEHEVKHRLCALRVLRQIENPEIRTIELVCLLIILLQLFNLRQHFIHRLLHLRTHTQIFIRVLVFH